MELHLNLFMQLIYLFEVTLPADHSLEVAVELEMDQAEQMVDLVV
tara:strand:- start:7 stop:141 length:135 start_codon:yes stop_codon:yes gene_type:complete